jgi:hypothetical protein
MPPTYVARLPEADGLVSAPMRMQPELRTRLPPLAAM